MQLATFALTTVSILTTVLAAGAPPIKTITITTSGSTFSSASHACTSRHPKTTSRPSKPKGTGTPKSSSKPSGLPKVSVNVEIPATADACNKDTNTTIRVPIDGVYTNRTVLAKVAALYITGVTGGNPRPDRQAITCVPYFKENGTGAPAGPAFTYGHPARLGPVAGTPNSVGSIFCMVPSPPGGGGKPGAGGNNGKGTGSASRKNNATAIITPPTSHPPTPTPTPTPAPINPATPPEPSTTTSQAPAAGAADLGVPTLASAALFGILGIMFTL